MRIRRLLAAALLGGAMLFALAAARECRPVGRGQQGAEGVPREGTRRPHLRPHERGRGLPEGEEHRHSGDAGADLGFARVPDRARRAGEVRVPGDEEDAEGPPGQDPRGPRGGGGGQGRGRTGARRVPRRRSRTRARKRSRSSKPRVAMPSGCAPTSSPGPRPRPTRSRPRATDDIRLATERAQADLQASVKDLSIELAEKVVEHNLDADTQRALIDSYIDAGREQLT